jgi:predicted negative regulator of RcsB-dependent stress response
VKDYITETEQVEQIKQWLKEYGNTILFSVIFVIAATFGWRYYQQHQVATRAQASSAYEGMVISYMGNQPKETLLKGERLIKEFPNTPYAKFAALTIAQLDVNNGDLQSAEQQLKWVIQNSKSSSSLKAIAQIRDARILLSQGKFPEALTQLDATKPKAFAVEVNTVKGDVYLAMGDKVKAEQAYQLAASTAPNGDAMTPLIQMKLADVTSDVALTKTQVAARK